MFRVLETKIKLLCCKSLFSPTILLDFDQITSIFTQFCYVYRVYTFHGGMNNNTFYPFIMS